MKYIIYPFYATLYCIGMVLFYISATIANVIIDPLQEIFGYDDLEIK